MPERLTNWASQQRCVCFSIVDQFGSHTGATSSLDIILPIETTVAIGLGKFNRRKMTSRTCDESLGVELHSLKSDDGITQKTAEVIAVAVVHVLRAER